MLINYIARTPGIQPICFGSERLRRLQFDVLMPAGIGMAMVANRDVHEAH